MYKSGLTELDAILAVARRGSFKAAADELQMSTTALSNAVAGMEKRLGVRLFHRTTRSVALTETGEQFIAQVAPALSDIHHAMANASSRQQRMSGSLRINTSLGAARRVFHPILAEYVRRYPAVSPRRRSSVRRRPLHRYRRCRRIWPGSASRTYASGSRVS